MASTLSAPAFIHQEQTGLNLQTQRNGFGLSGIQILSQRLHQRRIANGVCFYPIGPFHFVCSRPSGPFNDDLMPYSLGDGDFAIKLRQ